MSDLTTRTIIRCPVSEAASRLAEYFAKNAAPQGELTRLRLEVELPRVTSAKRKQLADVVLLTLRPIPSNQANPWQYETHWALEDRGDVPAVAGRLHVEPDRDYNAFSLCLTAQWGAPSHADRAILDAGTARTIVKEVSAAMLLSIAADIERSFRNDERAKLAKLAGGPRAPSRHFP